MARKLEELPVYHKAISFCAAVAAILEVSKVRRDRKLYEQIDDAADSVMSNMHEGFEQGTDASFANYLTHSKGSVGEIVARMRRAHVKRLISGEQLAGIDAAGDELGRMLGGFIRYLRRCDWRDRGRHT
jgi:four helix bundle protein